MTSPLFVSASPDHQGQEAAACRAEDRLRPLEAWPGAWPALQPHLVN